MAYQNVGTPRFYTNDLEWFDATGYAASPHYELCSTLPVRPQPFNTTTQFNIPYNLINPFVALLGQTIFTLHGI